MSTLGELVEMSPVRSSKIPSTFAASALLAAHTSGVGSMLPQFGVFEKELTATLGVGEGE